LAPPFWTRGVRWDVDGRVCSALSKLFYDIAPVEEGCETNNRNIATLSKGNGICNGQTAASRTRHLSLQRGPLASPVKRSIFGCSDSYPRYEIGMARHFLSFVFPYRARTVFHLPTQNAIASAVEWSAA